MFKEKLCVGCRVKILEQFVEAVNQLKGQRQQTVQTHVCAALCSLLKVRHLSTGVTSTLQTEHEENTCRTDVIYIYIMCIVHV